MREERCFDAFAHALAEQRRRLNDTSTKTNTQQEENQSHHARCHHVQELLKVNGALAALVEIRQDLKHERVLDIIAERGHRRPQLAGVDRARAVLIKQIECLLQLGNLLLAETRALELRVALAGRL